MTDDNGVVHILTCNGVFVACGPKVSARPWAPKPEEVAGEIMHDDRVVTCVQCLGWVMR